MREKRQSKFGATVINDATKSFWNFSNESVQTEMLMIYLSLGNKYISSDKNKAMDTLISFFEDTENEISVELVNFLKSNKGRAFLDIHFYEHYFGQMSYSRLIDNFITYFKEILSEIVHNKPQILKSRDQERLDFILGHDSMDDLLQSIAEKKIEELFYKGINDISKYFEERLGIQLFKDDQTKAHINLLIKQRNLVVHNRGKISKEYIKEFAETNFEIGDFMTFGYEQISEINLYLINYLVEIDIELSEKFKLELVKRRIN